MDEWNLGVKKELEDGRVWNGLAYVHNAPVDHCDCASCVGFFPPLPRFKVGQKVTAKAFTDCFKEFHQARTGLIVSKVVRIQPDLPAPCSMAPYFRVKADDPKGGYFEGSERFFVEAEQ